MLASGAFWISDRIWFAHSLQYSVRDYCYQRSSHILDWQGSGGCCGGGLLGYLYVRIIPSISVTRLTRSTSVLNGLTVKYFGISEFYMSIFKIFLMLGLMMYTFVTMVGGNPRNDAYGFRYWNDPVRMISNTSFLLTFYLPGSWR